MRRLSLLAIVTALALLPAQAALAQAYPTKAIRIVVPFATGGIADLFSRTIAAKLTEAWGQPVVVENRTGAGGNIGAELVAKAPPDGYTLVMGNIGTHAVNVSLFRNLSFDPVRDFTPVALVLEAEGLLAVHPAVKAANLKELIELARAQPGKLTYASGGLGTTSHLAGELFKAMAKLDITHVPYKGNVPAITDLLAGQTTMTFATMPTVLPHVRAGKLRGIAVIGAQRSPAIPELPTVAEALPGFEVNNWIGIFGPAGMSSEIALKLNREIMGVMRTPEVQKRLETEGARFSPNTPEQFAAFVKSETATWAKLIRDTGIRAE